VPRPGSECDKLSVDEFRKKVTEGDHLLATVLRGSLQFVKGKQRDVDAIARN